MFLKFTYHARTPILCQCFIESLLIKLHILLDSGQINFYCTSLIYSLRVSISLLNWCVGMAVSGCRNVEITTCYRRVLVNIDSARSKNRCMENMINVFQKVSLTFAVSMDETELQ